MRLLLLLALAASVLAAGCAEVPGSSLTPSPDDAAALFAQAAANVPERYGLAMSVTRDGAELMGADAAFDEPAQTSYFRLRMDEAMMQQGDAAGLGMMAPGGELSVFAAPQGTVVQAAPTRVMVLPSDDQTQPWMGAAQENEGFGAVTDPSALLAELSAQGLVVHTVEATTLRGQPALRLEVSFEEEGATREATIHLFQEPARVARVEMLVPAEEEPMGGALMTMDLLYDDEVDLAVPDALRRALGLRYESDLGMHFGGFGQSEPADEGVETWTFQVSGGLALAEVEAEVHDGMAAEGAAPLWSMPLAEGTRSVDGLTLTFDDADGDGALSEGDTLTIERAEGAEGASVALHDTVTGLRATPGAGAALAALAAVGAAVLARRR